MDPVWRNNRDAKLWYYPVSKPKGYMLILPGGGYRACVPHESDNICRWLNSEGYFSFLLHYSVYPSRFPDALNDCKEALGFIRKKIEPTAKIGVIGFSAGGHLASLLSNTTTSDVEKIDAVVLSYPVITLCGKYAHKGSANSLFGEANEEEKEKYSTQNLVSENTPPTYIWHTADDNIVHVKNTLLYINALAASRIYFESHIFPSGEHGLSLCENRKSIGVWKDEAILFLDKVFSEDIGNEK